MTSNSLEDSLGPRASSLAVDVTSLGHAFVKFIESEPRCSLGLVSQQPPVELLWNVLYQIFGFSRGNPFAERSQNSIRRFAPSSCEPNSPRSCTVSVNSAGSIRLRRPATQLNYGPNSAANSSFSGATVCGSWRMVGSDSIQAIPDPCTDRQLKDPESGGVQIEGVDGIPPEN